MPDYPTYNIQQIVDMRDRLVDKVFLPRFGTSPSGEVFQRLVHDLLGALPKGPTFSAVNETARGLAGRELDLPMCERFAWRIAANIRTLKAGRPVYPWAGQSEDEWVPMQVIRAYLTRGRRKQLGHHLDFRVLAGTPATMRISKFWSTKVTGPVARYLGFSKLSGKYPFACTDQFVGLRFYGRLEAARSRDEPFFHEIDCPQAFVDWNRAILRQRLRIEPCPFGWMHACHECVVGYQQCNAATHPVDYTQQHCNDCGQVAYFDPDISLERCIQCDRRNRLSRSDD